MKDIVTKINESKNKKWFNWRLVANDLDNETKELLNKVCEDTKNNSWYSMEEIEQRFWKGDLKDELDNIWDIVTTKILNIKHKKMAYELTPEDVIKQYSLATSGKQSKIEVIAQTCYMTHRYMGDNKNTMKGY